MTFLSIKIRIEVDISSFRITQEQPWHGTSYSDSSSVQCLNLTLVSHYNDNKKPKY